MKEYVGLAEIAKAAPGTVITVQTECYPNPVILVAIRAGDLAQGMTLAENWDNCANAMGEDYWRTFTAIDVEDREFRDEGELLARFEHDHHWIGENPRVQLSMDEDAPVWVVLHFGHQDEPLQEG